MKKSILRAGYGGGIARGRNYLVLLSVDTRTTFILMVMT
jgi:hypothetical protein